MSRVRVEEPTTVRSKLFDDLLRCHGPLPDRLRRTLQRLGSRVWAEVLRYALPHVDQRADEANRKQNVERAADHVGPEIADTVRAFPRESADYRDRDHDSCCRRHPV